MANYDKPRVVVVGAGAIGGIFGGLLSEGGLEVVLVDKRQDHVEAINRDGLKIVGHGGDRAIPVRATTEPAEAGVADIVLIQSKSYHTAEAATSARALLADGTVVVTFQNGLGNEETIAEIVGEDRVLGGLTEQGAKVEAPGVVRNYSDMASHIGELAGGLSNRAQAIAESLTAHGWRTSASTNIRREIWKKLLANVALSPASGSTDLSATELMAIPELRDVAFGALEEASAVARAHGIDLDVLESREVLLHLTGEGGTGAAKSSVCTDLENKRPTEVDYINGSITRLGREHGVPTPINDTLVAVIKGLQSHYM